jgi:phosphate transport system permease protein
MTAAAKTRQDTHHHGRVYGPDPARLARRQRAGQIFHVALLASALVGLVVLLALIVDVAVSGGGWLTPTLFQNYHSRFPEQAGMKSAIAGSVILIALTALFSFPLGVGAAIYLEEYASKNWLTNLLQINIANLAGVPSIVYGILGLAVFARFFGLLQPSGALMLALTGQTFRVGGQAYHLPFNVVEALGWSVGERGGLRFDVLGLPMQLPFEKSILAGALTMTLLVLPIVIIASREAIRAVPYSIREAAYGLGATRWQTVSLQVLPAALPGILTGMILALSRAMGEAAPLIILGAFVYVPFLPKTLWDQYTALPIQIFNWVQLPQEDYRVGLAGAAILVLLAILLAMNALAVYLRNRFERKW